MCCVSPLWSVRQQPAALQMLRRECPAFSGGKVKPVLDEQGVPLVLVVHKEGACKNCYRYNIDHCQTFGAGKNDLFRCNHKVNTIWMTVPDAVALRLEES